MVYCSGACKMDLPEQHFVKAMLTEWQTLGCMQEAVCARCAVRRRAGVGTKMALCAVCKNEKCITEFGPYPAKEWLAQHRKNVETWTCYDCHFPACMLCEARPPRAIPQRARLEGNYFCQACKYPDCDQCGRRREQRGTKQCFKAYTCRECQEPPEPPPQVQVCTQCEFEKPFTDFEWRTNRHRYHVCRACQHPVCFKCEKSFLEPDETWERGDRNERPYCSEDCQFPPCAGKGCCAARPRVWKYAYHVYTGSAKKGGKDWFCAECRPANGDRVCTMCTRQKPRTDFDKNSTNQNLYDVCRACHQHPVCFKCKKVFLKPEGEGRRGTPYCSAECRYPRCARVGCKTKRPQHRKYVYHVYQGMTKRPSKKWFCKKHR